MYFGSPPIIRNGLTLHLDSANVRSYSGSGINWKDLSGNANHGTLVNSPTFSTTNAGIMTFDGATSYVNCGHGGSLNIEPAVTMSLWIRIGALGTETTFRNMIGSQSARKHHFYVFGSGAGTWAMHLSHSWKDSVGAVGSGFKGTTSGNLLSANTWYHVTGVITPSNSGSHYYFINGQLVNSTTNQGFTSTVTNSQDVWIGKADNMFKGDIAIVKIYNRELTSTEILQDFNATRGRFGI